MIAAFSLLKIKACPACKPFPFLICHKKLLTFSKEGRTMI